MNLGRLGQRNHVLDWCTDPHDKEQILRKMGWQFNVSGECAINHVKTAEPKELYAVWDAMDPRNSILDGRAHWRHLGDTVERLYAAAIRVALPPRLATRPVTALFEILTT